MKKAHITRTLLAAAVSTLIAGFSTASMAADSEVSVSFAHGNNPGEPMYIGGEYWVKIMDEQGKGKMKVVHYPSDQLGSKNDVIDQMNMGEAVIAPLNATQFCDMGVPDFGIMMAPYIADSWEDVDKLMNTKLYKDLEKKLEEKGYKVLANNWRYGIRHTMTKKKVVHPADLKGLRMRVNSVPTINMMKALGAYPTPITLGEVYTALQQGTIDGLENPLTTIAGAHWEEVAKYIALDAHTYDVNSMVCSMQFWNSLTPEQQELLTKTAKEAGDYQNKAVEEKEGEARAVLEKAGVKFTEVDRNEWKKASESYYDSPDFKNWSEGLRDRLKAEMGK